MEALVIAALIAASIAGSAIMAWAIRRGKQFEQELEGLATAQGWSYRRVAASSRNQGHSELADGAAGWTLKLFTGGESRSSHSIWTDPDLGIPNGLAVYAAPLPEKTQAMMNVMMDKAGGLGRILLDSVFKGLGPDARDLRTVNDDDPATLMATPGAEAAFDPLKGAEELSMLNHFGSNPADVPFLVRSPEGLSLRINKRLKTADDALRFVEAARVLSGKLRG